MDAFNFTPNITDLSPELLCKILKCLPLREVLSVGMLCKKLLVAVNMHLKLCKSIDFCPDSINGYMPSSVTDDHMHALLRKCPRLEKVYGLHPVKVERRRLRKRSALTVPGIIEALTLCFHLKAIETSDLRLLEAVMQHLPQIEIIGRFQNRDGVFPPLASQKLKLQSFPRITSLHLIGVEVPELTPMPHLQHLYLQCVRFTKLQPFRVFSAQNLRSFVMKHCMGPSMSLRYLSLVIALSSSPNLKHLELARVPLPGGLFQRAVEDSHRQNGFVNLKTLVISGCKGILEADLGHLMIVSSKNLETLLIQPSITKDSLFVSLSYAQCIFPSLRNLHLGYMDTLNHSGEWSNDALLSFGLADIPDTPSSITDSGMKTISQLFPHVKALTVSNCPHLMIMYQWMPTPNVNSWSELTHLTLQKNHCLQLSSFTLFVSVLPRIEVIVLNEMFKEPPKGCSHVGLSAGTGLGMSSAVVSNQDEHIAVQGHHQDLDHPGEEENDEVQGEFMEVDEDNQEPHFMVLRGDFFDEDDDSDYMDYESRYFNELRRERAEYSPVESSDFSDDNADNERSFNFHNQAEPSSSAQNGSGSFPFTPRSKNGSGSFPFTPRTENNNNSESKYYYNQTSERKQTSSKSVGVQADGNIPLSTCEKSVLINLKKEESSFDSVIQSEELKCASTSGNDPHQPSTSKAGKYDNSCSEASNMSDSGGVGNNRKLNACARKSKRLKYSKNSANKTNILKETERRKGLSVKTNCSNESNGTDDSIYGIDNCNSALNTEDNKIIRKPCRQANVSLDDECIVTKPCHIHVTRIEDEITINKQFKNCVSPNAESHVDSHKPKIKLSHGVSEEVEDKKCEVISEESSSESNKILFYSDDLNKSEFPVKNKPEDINRTFCVSDETRKALSDKSLANSMKCFVLVSKIENESHISSDIRSSSKSTNVPKQLDSLSADDYRNLPGNISPSDHMHEAHVSSTDSKITNANEHFTNGNDCFRIQRYQNSNENSTSINESKCKPSTSRIDLSEEEKKAAWGNFDLGSDDDECTGFTSMWDFSTSTTTSWGTVYAFSAENTVNMSALEESDFKQNQLANESANVNLSESSESLPDIKIKQNKGTQSVIDVVTGEDESKISKINQCHVVLTKIDEIESNSVKSSHNSDIAKRRKPKKNKIQTVKNNKVAPAKNIDTKGKDISTTPTSSIKNSKFSSYDPYQPSTSKTVLDSDRRLTSVEMSHVKDGKYCELKVKSPSLDAHESSHNSSNGLESFMKDIDSIYRKNVDCYAEVARLDEEYSDLRMKSQYKKIKNIDCSRIEIPIVKSENVFCKNSTSLDDNNESTNCSESDSESSDLPLSKRLKKDPDEPHHSTISDYYIMVPDDPRESIKILNTTGCEVSEAASCRIFLNKVDNKNSDKLLNFPRNKREVRNSIASIKSETTESFNPNLPSTSKARNCVKSCRSNESSKNYLRSGKYIENNKSNVVKDDKRTRKSRKVDDRDIQKASVIPHTSSSANSHISEVCFAHRYKYSSIDPEAATVKMEILKIKKSDAIAMSVVPKRSRVSSLAPKAPANSIEIESADAPSSSSSKHACKNNSTCENLTTVESNSAAMATQSAAHTGKRMKRKRLALSQRNGKFVVKKYAANKTNNVPKLSLRCSQKRVPVISLISQGTQANSADIRRSLRRVRCVAMNTRKAASSSQPKANSSHSGEISAKVLDKRPKSKNPSETQDKSTSTSDPLLEDDAVQTLQMSSDTLLSFTVVACGISDLTLDRCPRLYHLEVQACRILKKFQLNTCPSMRRLNISQCPKLSISEVSDAVIPLTTDSYFLVSYEPCMQSYYPGDGEKAILSKAASNQSILLCHDFHEPSTESIQASSKEKLFQWLHYLIRLHTTLNYSRGKLKRKKSIPPRSPDYPWSHDLRRIHGSYVYSQSSEFCQVKGRYNLLTNNPIFGDAFETHKLTKEFPSVNDCEAFKNYSTLSFEAITKYFQMQKRFIGFYIPITEFNRTETYKLIQPHTPQ